METQSDRAGGLDGFLAALLAFESGISPSEFDWYLRNYDTPALRYVEVEAPGRLVRDPRNGEPVFREVSVREYFESLGVARWFDPDDPACLRRMQYRSMNAWGFVGYQFGEATLIANGHYRPEQVAVTLEDGTTAVVGSWYLGHVPAADWAQGRRNRLATDPESGATVLATDVNRWRGTFTGLDGAVSFEALQQPQVQDAVVRRTLRNDLRRVRESLSRHALDWDEALRQRFVFDGVEFACTESGIAAATHLRGAEATARLLIEGARSHDELGTSILSYVDKFGGYDMSGL